jgi:glycosyltransferase involved in cell wall biosynthesis
MGEYPLGHKPPRVTIGLPVYNGSEFLSESLESLLAQSFDDFELIICDNASTDATEEICQSFADRDARIRYQRNAHNLGMAENFNLAFSCSKGQYFKWATHDDICKAEFLRRCVEVLDRDREVVLAYPGTLIIDENSRKLESYDREFPFDSPSPAERFKASLTNSKCFEIFGLIRRETLAKTPLIGSYAHPDGVLLARLALLGRFEKVPGYLFYLRRHGQQSTRMWVDYHRYIVFIDPKLRNRMLFPAWRMHYEYFRSISMFPLSWSERARCYTYLAQHTYARREQLRGDVTFHVGRKVPWTRAIYRRLTNIQGP